MITTDAVTIVTDYFTAWSSKDVTKAETYLADDVTIVAPNGTFTGHTGFHEFMDGFVAMITSVTDFTIYGDDTTALVWYDTHLQPVPSITAGERHTIHDGKITRILIAFDQLPLAQAFGGAAPSHNQNHD